MKRREERIKRWDTPVSGPAARLHAWAHMLLLDHGLIRFAFLNKHRVAHAMWRSAQPMPHQFRRFKAEGFKTVVKVRGGRGNATWQLQKDTCDRIGLKIVEFDVRSREAPERELVLNAETLFATIDYPAIIHCKAGADRTGFVAALYLMLREGRSAAEAREQLSLRFGHYRSARAGILGAFFDYYRADGEAKGIGFLPWVRDRYDPKALERHFASNRWTDLFLDRLVGRE